MYVVKTNQLLKLRKFEPRHDNNIGSIIKHYRKKNNLTLEETSDHICSISYLSKLENNMIQPSDKFVEPILARLGLSIDNYNDIINPPNYDEIISLWLDNKLIETLTLKEGVQTHIKLNNYIYYVNHLMIDESNNLFNDLVLFGNNMQNNELSIFIFTTAYLNFKQGKYYYAFTLLSSINSDLINNNFLSLINLYLLKCAFNLNYYTYITNKYQPLLTEFLNSHQFELIKQIEFDYIKNLIQQDLCENELFTILKNKQLNDNQNNILISFYYYINHNYEKSWEYLMLIKGESEEVYIYKLIISDKLNLASHKTLLERPRKIINKSHQLIVEYYQTKQYFPKRITTFFQQTLIVNKNLPQTSWIIYFWYLESIPFFNKKSYYKAANIIMQNLLRHIKSFSRDF